MVASFNESEFDVDKKRLDIIEAEVIDGNKKDLEVKLINFDKLNASTDSPEERADLISNTLEESYNKVAEKYGIKVKYQDFRSIIEHFQDYGKNQEEFNKLFLAKIVGSVSSHAKVTLAITIGFLIENISKQVAKIATELSPEAYAAQVESVERFFGYIDRLEGLQRKYGLNDPGKGLQLMGNKQTTVDGGNVGGLSKSMLDQLIKRIKTAEHEESGDNLKINEKQQDKNAKVENKGE